MSNVKVAMCFLLFLVVFFVIFEVWKQCGIECFVHAILFVYLFSSKFRNRKSSSNTHTFRNSRSDTNTTEISEADKISYTNIVSWLTTVISKPVIFFSLYLIYQKF